MYPADELDDLFDPNAPADHPEEECGVFGVWAPGKDVARMTYFALHALQHRGQESAGIAIGDGSTVLVRKDEGLVTQVFSDSDIASLKGDLAIGHVKAIDKLKDKEGVSIYNLGTGVGYSVLQVVAAFEKACGKKIPYEIKPRRAGDIATCYSDASKAKRELGWVAERGLDEMCEDAWRWQSMNPNGFED